MLIRLWYVFSPVLDLLWAAFSARVVPVRRHEHIVDTAFRHGDMDYTCIKFILHAKSSTVMASPRAKDHNMFCYFSKPIGHH